MIEHRIKDPKYNALCEKWQIFLKPFEDSVDKITIEYSSEYPVFFDSEDRKFQINFVDDRNNYHKTKAGISTEPLSKAVGAGKHGKKVLDLSAGLGIDAVFLAQMGYQVTALERNPFIYLALKNAHENLTAHYSENLDFIFIEAQAYLEKYSTEFDVCYFDPMFPPKRKSSLPKQEMVFFKNLVGLDEDGTQVIKTAIESKRFKRCTVKRPLSAEVLILSDKIRPSGQIKGKIIRYDIY